MANLNQGIRIREDLLVHSRSINGWKAGDSFPVNDLTEPELRDLRSLVALEIFFPIHQEGRDLINLLYLEYYRYIKAFIFSSSVPTYLFVSEHKAMPKNRIRSYKGLIPKEIKESKLAIQREINIMDNYSIIVALIRLDNGNFDNVIDFFSDSSTSFLITSHESTLFSDDFLLRVSRNFMGHKGRSSINYAKLILEFCLKGDIICRTGGDGGNFEISFQVFCESKLKDLLLIQAENSFAF